MTAQRGDAYACNPFRKYMRERELFLFVLTALSVQLRALIGEAVCRYFLTEKEDPKLKVHSLYIWVKWSQLSVTDMPIVWSF